MIRSFRHEGLAKFYATGSHTGIRPEHSARLRVILGRLNAAKAPGDMGLPGLRLHPLKGELAGFYSVSVSGNWRVVFRFDEAHAVDVDYRDYH